MGFRRARTQEQFDERREEILVCCKELFEKEGYEGVNFKAVSQKTTLNRTSIYNYYNTKEEILLDILLQELLAWIEEISQNPAKDKETIASLLLKSLATREVMMNLLCILPTSLEPNSSLEFLTNFKLQSVCVLEKITELFARVYLDTLKLINIPFLFFSLVLGLYPLCNPTAKQIKAMQNVQSDFVFPNFEEICYQGIIHLLTTT